MKSHQIGNRPHHVSFTIDISKLDILNLRLRKALVDYANTFWSSNPLWSYQYIGPVEQEIAKKKNYFPNDPITQLPLLIKRSCYHNRHRIKLQPIRPYCKLQWQFSYKNQIFKCGRFQWNKDQVVLAWQM